MTDALTLMTSTPALETLKNRITFYKQQRLKIRQSINFSGTFDSEERNKIEKIEKIDIKIRELRTKYMKERAIKFNKREKLLEKIMEQYGAYDHDIYLMICDLLNEKSVYKGVMKELEYDHIYNDKRLVKKNGDWTKRAINYMDGEGFEAFRMLRRIWTRPTMNPYNNNKNDRQKNNYIWRLNANDTGYINERRYYTGIQSNNEGISNSDRVRYEYLKNNFYKLQGNKDFTNSDKRFYNLMRDLERDIKANGDTSDAQIYGGYYNKGRYENNKLTYYGSGIPSVSGLKYITEINKDDEKIEGAIEKAIKKEEQMKRKGEQELEKELKTFLRICL